MTRKATFYGGPDDGVTRDVPDGATAVSVGTRRWFVGSVPLRGGRYRLWTRDGLGKYDIARAMIGSGAWRIDLDAGVVYGRGGRRIGTVRGPRRYWCRRDGACDRHKVVPDHKLYRHLSVVMPDGRRQWMFEHVVIWEHANGPRPDGLQVDHVNGDYHDNRIANLEAVSFAENQRRRWAKWRHRRVRAELSARDEAVRAMRDTLRAGRIVGRVGR